MESLFASLDIIRMLSLLKISMAETSNIFRLIIEYQCKFVESVSSEREISTLKRYFVRYRDVLEEIDADVARKDSFVGIAKQSFAIFDVEAEPSENYSRIFQETFSDIGAAHTSHLSDSSEKLKQRAALYEHLKASREAKANI